MQGKDMIGRARTGTGKTLAFGIPIMDKILSYNEKNGFVSLSHVEFFLIYPPGRYNIL
jgi:superfamily II DNA/RNA helicase